MTDGFYWTESPCGPLLRCAALEDLANHLFSTRRTALRGDAGEAGWGCLGQAVGVSPEQVLRVRQVHGTTCVAIGDAGDAWPSDRRPEADALLTTDRDVAIAVQVADCTPILIADRATRAVAAVHAGWRGSAAAIAESVILKLQNEHRVPPANLVVAVGPSIGPCCYEVGEEVRERFRSRFGHAADAWFTASPKGSPRPHLDLWSATADRLAAAGVPREQIHLARLCTACNLDTFHSYRVEGPGTGRLAGIIRLR